jgi:hypothetical protein
MIRGYKNARKFRPLRQLLTVIAVICAVCICVPHAGADEVKSVPAVNSLRIPTTPATVLLGVEQTAVEKPTTPAALAATVLNNTENLTSLPSDFTMQVTPFWMSGHPSLTWRKDTTRSVGESLIRTLKISAAAAQVGTVDAKSTGLSVAAATSVLSGKTSRTTVEALERLEKHLIDKSIVIQTYLTEEDPTDEEIVAFNDSLNEARTKLNPKDSLNDIQTRRVGWKWDIAGGAAWEFADGAASKSDFLGGGAWTTVSHDFESGESFVFVARWMDNKLMSSGWIADFGLRVIHESSLWSISLEGVKRYLEGDVDNKDQYRYTALFEYKLRDGTVLSFTVGRDFDKDADNSLLARLGLSLGLNPVRSLSP